MFRDWLQLRLVKNNAMIGESQIVYCDRNDHRNVAVIAQGEAEHQRTRKNGCVLSIRATGDGDMELMSRLNTDKAVYVSGNDNVHDELITVPAHKFIRETGEVAVAEPVAQSRIAQRFVEVAKGSPRLGVICFYTTQIPGPVAVKVPFFLLAIALISRTIGLGDFMPRMSILRAGWIVVRVVIDFVLDSDSSVDGWDFAFLVFLAWPLYVLCAHLWQTWWKSDANSCDQDPSGCASSRREATTPSQRSNATTRTMSETASIDKGEDEGKEGNECQAGGLLLQKLPDQKSGDELCTRKKAVWCRIALGDGRAENKGKANRYDGCDWIKLRPEHG